MTRLFREVTTSVKYQLPDDEFLPITKCVCGQEFQAWDFTISIYSNMATECPKCKAKLFFSPRIAIYQLVKEEENV